MTEQLGWEEKQANAETAKLQSFIKECGGLDEAARVLFGETSDTQAQGVRGITQEKFRDIVDLIREETGEACHFSITSFAAMCECDDRPAIWFDEIDEDAASEWIHDHAAH